jgi:hypothetical protein
VFNVGIQAELAYARRPYLSHDQLAGFTEMNRGRQPVQRYLRDNLGSGVPKHTSCKSLTYMVGTGVRRGSLMEQSDDSGGQRAIRQVHN